MRTVRAQRAPCVLALAALAKVDLRPRTRMSEPKDKECEFAKRTHLSHVESVVCVFQGLRNHGCLADICCKRRDGTRSGYPPDRNLVHR